MIKIISFIYWFYFSRENAFIFKYDSENSDLENNKPLTTQSKANELLYPYYLRYARHSDTLLSTYMFFINSTNVQSLIKLCCFNVVIIFRSFSLDYDVLSRPKFYRKLQPYIPLGDTVSFLFFIVVISI